MKTTIDTIPTKGDYLKAIVILENTIKAKIVEQANIDKANAEKSGHEYVPFITIRVTPFLIGKILEEVSRSSINIGGSKIPMIYVIGTWEESIETSIDLIANKSLEEIGKFNHSQNYVEEYEHKKDRGN